MTPEQEACVRRAQNGDRQAFAQLFREHRAIVLAVAYRMLGPGSDLDDIVQEVFLQVHRSLPAFRGQAKFSTWLHRIAVNVVLMQRRRARSRPVLRFEERPLEYEGPGDAPPDEHVQRQRRMQAFRGLIERLSEKKRDVFVLHELEGMAPVDIAKVVGCPVLTVRTRLFYARKQLARLMAEDPLLSEFAASMSLGRGGKKSSAQKTRAAEAKKKVSSKRAGELS